VWGFVVCEHIGEPVWAIILASFSDGIGVVKIVGAVYLV